MVVVGLGTARRHLIGLVAGVVEGSKGRGLATDIPRGAHCWSGTAATSRSLSDTQFMVINIRLIGRQRADTNDPLPRDWWGYDPEATPEQLWDHNRGIWSLNGSRIATERWVALNYQSRVVLVAELQEPGYEILADNRTGVSKKALFGRVLPAGHPVYEALFGAPVEYRRNPVSYDPDPNTRVMEDDRRSESRDAPGARGQGLQMDPEVRKAIENAAQDRLMNYYRKRGWTVTDTRQNRPYDAVAMKGRETRYLEAKGTQSKGGTVIVTPNEVEHAQQNPGLCIMGIWSGMRLLDGAVDPEEGDFTILPFDPEERQLRPRAFDWTLPGSAP